MKQLKLRYKAFEEIRRLPGVRQTLQQIANRAAEAAGEGYGGEIYAGRTRDRVNVMAQTPEAQRKDPTNQNLVRALGAIRGR